MNVKIGSWASDASYGGSIATHRSVANALIPGVPPLLHIDTAGCSGYEEYQDASGSSGNVGEACVAAAAVQRLMETHGVRACDIGVISPYKAQVELLRAVLPDEVESRTVDGFQGREMVAIVLVLVRSNKSRDIGFLADSRRINVAATRARMHLCIIGDSDTAGADAFISGLLSHAASVGEVASAEEFTSDAEKFQDAAMCAAAQARARDDGTPSFEDVCRAIEAVANQKPLPSGIQGLEVIQGWHIVPARPITIIEGQGP